MLLPNPNQPISKLSDTATLLCTSSDAAWIWDCVTDTFTWVHGGPAFSGSTASGVGSWLNQIHQADREATISSLLAAGTNASTWQHQYRYILADDALVNIISRATFETANGELVRVLGTMLIVPSIPAASPAPQPVIGSTQSSEADNERLRFLVDNSSEFVSMSNADGKMIYLNSAGRQMLGIADDAEDLGKITDYAHPIETEEDFKVRKAHLEQHNRWEGSSYLRHFITGEAIPVYVTTLTLKDPHTGIFLGRATIVRDLRPELEARKAIQEREERLRTAVELAELGTWSIDLEAGKVSYSDRVRDIYGLPDGPVTEMLGIHPEDLTKVAADMEQALLPGSEGVYNNIHRALNIKTGEIRYVHSQGRVLFDDTGTPYIMTGTLRDITEHKKTEQALERLVAARTEELHKANERLEEANTHLQQTNSELEQFAYIASHDLQEPLRKIAVFSNMLGKMAGLPPDAKTLGERINGASTRMALLIRDLLDFSRLIKAERNMRPINLNKVLAAVVNDFELQIAEKEAVITADNLPTIEAVGLQMNQLFYNLISNSLKFVKDGIAPHIQVQCRALEGEETSSHGIVNDDNRVVNYFITISDNGVGFNSHYAEQIFEVFKRLHSRHVYPGSGIGLALCKRIVQNHNGIMTARSEEGKGTVISIILPSHQPTG